MLSVLWSHMLLAVLLGCSGGEMDSSMDCALQPDVTWEGWGQGFFLTYCQACHGSTAADRHGAPLDQVFDTWADVVEREDDIRRTVLVEGSMPLGGGVYEEDLTDLDVLLSCSD